MDGEGGAAGRSGSGGMSVLDWMDGGTSWFAMPAPSGGTGFRGQGAAAPPVATPVEQQFQTLAVTRPMTGTSVMPGQQIIVADPQGNRFTTTVPGNIQPGMTFHVRVPMPTPAAPPPRAAPAASSSSSSPPAMNDLELGELGEFVAVEDGAADDATAATAAAPPPRAAGGATDKSVRFAEPSSSSLTDVADVVRAAVLGTPLSRLELTEGAPLRLTDAMAVGRPVGRVARAAYTDGNKPSAILLVLRDAQTDALSFVRLGGAGALNGWSNQPALPLATLERLQLPEEEPGALFADFQKESVGAASLVALRGRAQRTLALLCTRRAVMRLVSACGASSALSLIHI